MTVPRSPTLRSLAAGNAGIIFPGTTFAKIGLIVLVLAVFPMLIAMPSVNGVIRNSAIFAGTVWLLVAWGRFKLPFQIPGTVALVLLLQLWSGVTIAYIAFSIGRVHPIGTIDFYLMRHVFVFFLAALVAGLVPKWRVGLVNALLAMLGLLALAGMIDFVAPGLWAPIRHAMDAAVIDRPVGLSGYHSHLAILCNFGCAILCGRLVFRKLMVWETGLFVLLASAGIAAQARAHVPGLAVCVLFFLVAAVVRNRFVGTGLVAAAAAMVAVALVFFPAKFDTLIHTDPANEPTLNGRRIKTWPQVDYVLEKFPWTGIGPEPVFFGNVAMGTDKWAPFHAIDAGFLLLAACYGWIGLGIAILIFVTWAIGMAGVAYARKTEDPFRVSTAVALLLCLVSVTVSMYANNVITWDDAIGLLFLLGGLMAPRVGVEP